VLGADGGLVSSSAPGRAVLKRAVSDCRKSLVRHDLFNSRDMDLISQSLDFVARSHHVVVRKRSPKTVQTRRPIVPVVVPEGSV
jgi:hypothetical protein